MEIADKIESVLRCIKLGMALEEAYLLAECSYEEQDAMNKDEDFQYRVQVQRSIQERELLTKLNAIIDMNVLSGKGEDLRWFLSKINRKRYGDGKVDDEMKDIAKKLLGAAENLTTSQRMEEFEKIRAEAVKVV